MSHHFSGVRALAAPVADITDLYAFPSPEHPDRLVLVLNALPDARATDCFSDSIVYRIRLRPVTIAGTGQQAAFAVGDDEYRLDCRFSAPTADHPANHPDVRQDGVCTTSSGSMTPIHVHVVPDDDRGTPRVFAGARLDPFFINVVGLAKTVITGRPAFDAHVSNGSDPNGLAGRNVLSIVVEVDPSALFDGEESPMLAVVGETVTAGTPEFRIERVGRPEIGNIILSPSGFDQTNQALEIRDLYNQEDAFALEPAYLGAYRARLDANLRFYDGLDDHVGWPTADGAHPLTSLLLDDYLVVDTSLPFCAGSFLAIEQAMIAGEAHTVCGGRSLNDDIVDKLYGWMVTASTGAEISDGVDHNGTPAAETFPFLAVPNEDPPTTSPPPVPVPGSSR